MKHFRYFLALSIAVIALSIINVSAYGKFDGKPPKSIEQQVHSRILKLPYYEVFDVIKFSVNGDTVTLSGKVRNAVNKKEAEASIRQIDGVARVINNIEILPVGSFDESIRFNLYRTLANSGSLSRYLWTVNPDVRLIVDRGHVTLEGTVSNTGDYNTMNILANGVPGVFSVQNNLVVDSKR